MAGACSIAQDDPHEIPLLCERCVNAIPTDACRRCHLASFVTCMLDDPCSALDWLHPHKSALGSLTAFPTYDTYPFDIPRLCQQCIYAPPNDSCHFCFRALCDNCIENGYCSRSPNGLRHWPVNGADLCSQIMQPEIGPRTNADIIDTCEHCGVQDLWRLNKCVAYHRTLCDGCYVYPSCRGDHDDAPRHVAVNRPQYVAPFNSPIYAPLASGMGFHESMYRQSIIRCSSLRGEDYFGGKLLPEDGFMFRSDQIFYDEFGRHPPLGISTISKVAAKPCDYHALVDRMQTKSRPSQDWLDEVDQMQHCQRESFGLATMQTKFRVSQVRFDQIFYDEFGRHSSLDISTISKVAAKPCDYHALGDRMQTKFRLRRDLLDEVDQMQHCLLESFWLVTMETK